ncbi:sigma-70 family RNA polymerase sigma factor [Prolixibacteraceae bacterium Z1-6]|uniref:Sigma-70 family RNA polymerase sigma factor n=1 Tax=Draconibacterium aestuarii TaxID=2998507 RepID=A0A9X3J725_9BACT|nr:sigma-70 family RNA polymerase sigma factor [Prolixibacteraceae bacterium Z1-6]
MEVLYNHSEQKLVRLCKKGDAKAQFKLYKLYCKGMFNVAMRMTNNKSVTEDVLQDAFVKAFLEINKLKDEKAFGGWLKRIVINRCIDVSRKATLVFTDLEALQNQHLEIADDVDCETDPELIHNLIKKLPDGAREILVLRALEGFKHAEIGEKLGISESTAKTQFFRAKQLLAQMINENEGEHRKIFKGEAIKA